MLTVFTPTYNRGYILEKVYLSLINQSCKEFIWLIVDDGSTDDTEGLVKGWILERKISIKYIKQNNMGKYRATNTAIDNCDSELMAFLDSDDYYKSFVVEFVTQNYDFIMKDKKVAGIIGRRGTEDGCAIGKELNIDNLKIKYFDLVKKYGFYGDTFRVYKTEILKINKYPEIKDKFIPENVMLGKIDEVYDMYFVNEIFTVSEYLNDGYTKNINKMYKKNPEGYKLSLIQSVKNKNRLMTKIKVAINYILWCEKYKYKNPIREFPNKFMYLVLYPVAKLFKIIRFPERLFKQGGLLSE